MLGPHSRIPTVLVYRRKSELVQFHVMFVFHIEELFRLLDASLKQTHMCNVARSGWRHRLFLGRIQQMWYPPCLEQIATSSGMKHT